MHITEAMTDEIIKILSNPLKHPLSAVREAKRQAELYEQQCNRELYGRRVPAEMLVQDGALA